MFLYFIASDETEESNLNDSKRKSIQILHSNLNYCIALKNTFGAILLTELSKKSTRLKNPIGKKFTRKGERIF